MCHKDKSVYTCASLLCKPLQSLNFECLLKVFVLPVLLHTYKILLDPVSDFNRKLQLKSDVFTSVCVCQCPEMMCILGVGPQVEVHMLEHRALPVESKQV